VDTFESFGKAIYTVNEATFDEIALNLFHFQAVHNPVYKEYLTLLGVNLQNVRRLEDIPFLPITLYKSKDVRTGSWTEQITFTSSGTIGEMPSRHHVKSKDFYLANAAKCFHHFYGPPEDFVILGLLPSYQERTGSSLIFMVDHFMRAGGHSLSGYYRDDHHALAARLEELASNNVPTILWGVTYALLDFAEAFKLELGRCIVIETGGMKGRRVEITREELHGTLQNRFGVTAISSEYGMTELMSQAYAKKSGIFGTPPWMKILIRDPEDPFGRLPEGRPGGINIIDLANIHTCAFVETQDLGRVAENGSFEILGRLDNSDIRGCSLLG
jgi:hypothetical protein